MKIIKSDDYDREIYDDELITENISEYYGKIIVKLLNKKAENSYELELQGFRFRLVEDDHKLIKLSDIYRQ